MRIILLRARRDSAYLKSMIAEPINSELDYVHERLNNIVVEAAAITDLTSGATLAETITRVNALTQILRNAGLLKFL